MIAYLLLGLLVGYVAGALTLLALIRAESCRWPQYRTRNGRRSR
jgi:hypothetical protein